MVKDSAPITPAGHAALSAEYRQLLEVERPAIVEVVSWAASNGDRSENGDYVYGRKRMREIDRRLGYLAKRLAAVRVIDPAQQPDRDAVFFGATVTLVDDQDQERDVTIVGDDEADAGAGRIGWSTPLARALRGARVDDLRTVELPGGTQSIGIVAIGYPQLPH